MPTRGKRNEKNKKKNFLKEKNDGPIKCRMVNTTAFLYEHMNMLLTACSRYYMGVPYRNKFIKNNY